VIRGIVLAIAGALVGWQLFVPPIIGLSDQGDFGRMIGRFGYAPADQSASLFDAFVQPKYVRDPSARVPSLEQFGPEYLFVGSAVALNKIISRSGMLDIRVIGFVHWLAFLAAFAWLLRSTGPVVWIAALIVLTDVGYAAYWNSFYTEPATCIFFILLAAESAAMLRGFSTPVFTRWCLWAALLVWAKSSNYPLALLLVPFAIRLGWIGKSRLTGMIGATAIAAIAIVTMKTRPIPMRQATTYNAIFMAILPESSTPQADLSSLGLDPSLASFSGTGAWTQHTAFLDLVNQGVLRDRVSGATVAKFYLTHPARIWRRIGALMPIAFSLRPEWCGNFEKSAGRPPGSKTTSFTLWSAFHERVLGPIGRPLLIALAVTSFAIFSQRLRFQFLGIFSACALIAFLTAALGDAWDNVKHMFLFNLLFDAWIISILTLALGRTART
jgi:hypothetical protein